MHLTDSRPNIYFLESYYCYMIYLLILAHNDARGNCLYYFEKGSRQNMNLKKGCKELRQCQKGFNLHPIHRLINTHKIKLYTPYINVNLYQFCTFSSIIMMIFDILNVIKFILYDNTYDKNAAHVQFYIYFSRNFLDFFKEYTH